MVYSRDFILFFFFFNDTATTEIYTLSLHDALPIYGPRARVRPARRARARPCCAGRTPAAAGRRARAGGDRKSTRLNSSHANISYAVFCLKKKKHIQIQRCSINQFARAVLLCIVSAV